MLSGIISLIFYGVALTGIWYGGDYVTDFLTNKISNSTVRAIVDTLSNILSFVGLSLILLVLYKHIILVLTGPFMGLLSANIEKREVGSSNLKEDKFGLGYSFYRGMRIAVRNIIRELFFSLILLVLGVIVPPLAIVTTPLIFLIQAYYAGFASFDYYLERHLDYKNSIQFVRGNRLLAMSNGSVFLALLLIPIVGAFLAPSLSTSAAALALNKKFY